MKKMIYLFAFSISALTFVGTAQGAIYGEGNTKCQAYTSRIDYAKTYASENLSNFINPTDSRILAVESWIKGYLTNRKSISESPKQTIQKIRAICLQQPQLSVGQVLISIRR